MKIEIPGGTPILETNVPQPDAESATETIKWLNV